MPRASAGGIFIPRDSQALPRILPIPVSTPPPPPRLHLLHAREADVAVIFRRGPSRHVEVVRWDTARDTFERGHWFRGRIYERRCDLSPDGELLVYFAGQYNSRTRTRTHGERESLYAWTAVSRPPWLTALALWPKDDCWHGGGLFLRRRHLLLNHRPEQAAPHPEHRPHGLRVEPDPDARGENDPLYSRRLARDGWEVVREWEVEQVPGSWGYRTVAPGELARRHPGLPYRVVMERRIDWLTYREDFRVEGPRGPVPLPSARLDWVDWDRRGRLVVLRSGAVHAAEVTAEGVDPLRTLADFTADRFEPREAPPYARSW
jgi:hypothetical protein